jgi:hypothetical protein
MRAFSVELLMLKTHQLKLRLLKMVRLGKLIFSLTSLREVLLTKNRVTDSRIQWYELTLLRLNFALSYLNLLEV